MAVADVLRTCVLIFTLASLVTAQNGTENPGLPSQKNLTDSNTIPQTQPTDSNTAPQTKLTDSNTTSQTQPTASNTTSQTKKNSEPEPYAEIVLGGLYRLIFQEKKMRRFQQCFCNATNSVCIVDYFTTPERYRFRAKLAKDTHVILDDHGNITFLCHPGDVPSLRSFRCSRRMDSYEFCRKQKTCRLVHFFADDLGSKCGGWGCFNLAWSGYSVEFRNFSGNVQFHDGACGENLTQITTALPACTGTPPRETEAQFAGDAGHACTGKEDKTFIIVASVGWALLAVNIFAQLFCLIFRANLSRAKQEKEPISSKFETQQNQAYGLKEHQEEINHTHSLHPTHVKLAGNDGIHYNSENSDPGEEDVYTVIEEETSSDGNKIEPKSNCKVSKCPAKGTSSFKDGQNLPKEGGSGRECKTVNDSKYKGNEATRPDLKHERNEEERDCDTAGDYTRLQSGRLDTRPELTNSLLATYNTAAAAEGEHQEEPAVYPVDRDNDNLNRNSGGYTVLENETDLIRDSTGCTTGTQGESVKQQASNSKHPENGYLTSQLEGDKNLWIENPQEKSSVSLSSLSESGLETSAPGNPYDVAHSIEG